MAQRSLFPDAFEIQEDALDALHQLEIERGLERIAAARRADSSLANLEELARALEWLRGALDGRRDREAVADAFLALPRAGLSATASAFIDRALARFGLRGAGEFVDAGERVHAAALRLVLGQADRARRALWDWLARPGGGEGRADLWSQFADACLGCDRPEEANAARVRALLIDPERVDLLRARDPGLRDLHAELRAEHTDPEARALLFPHAWLRRLVHVEPENDWLDAHLAHLRAAARADAASAPARRWRRFALLLFEDRSRPVPVRIELREELQALDPVLFGRVMAVLRQREAR